MIAPTISSSAVSARLDALPDRLRTALAGEIERLGRELRSQLGRRRRLSLVIDDTGDTVTATILLRTAGVPPAFVPTLPSPASGGGLGRGRSTRPQSRFPRRSSSLPSIVIDMLPDLRAGLEAAAREAIQR